jgi:hypothetical protein
MVVCIYTGTAWPNPLEWDSARPRRGAPCQPAPDPPPGRPRPPSSAYAHTSPKIACSPCVPLRHNPAFLPAATGAWLGRGRGTGGGGKEGGVGAGGEGNEEGVSGRKSVSPAGASVVSCWGADQQSSIGALTAAVKATIRESGSNSSDVDSIRIRKTWIQVDV